MLLQQGEDEEGGEKAASVTAEQLQRQLEILNQRNYDNYRKLTEIQKQQPRLKERKVGRKKAQMDALRALENPGEVLREYITAEIADPAEETRRQAEAEIYALFSEETKEIYRQYLIQNRTEDTTFLQHIMAQPEEDEARQEVMQILAQVQKRDGDVQTKREVREWTETAQPVIVQNMTQELRRRMTILHEQQSDIVYQQWIQPAQMYWHETKEARTELLREERESREEALLRQTEVSKTVKAPQAFWPMEEAAVQSLQHMERVLETEEFYRTEEEKRTIGEMEQKLEEIRQTMESRMEQYQEERAVELAEKQRSLLTKRAELVHKEEEQIRSEEILENIRMREQTKREEYQKETTIHQNRITQNTVAETVNHIQMKQTDDIEELIRQNVKKQLGNLSDQVYGRLEKKLQTERKRRGYS